MIKLPIEHDKSRRWAVGDHCGDTFESDGDYDGIAVVIELRTADEAKAVVAALMGGDNA